MTSLFQEYLEDWKQYDEHFIYFDAKEMTTQNIPNETKVFLSKLGLPKDGALYLNFENTNYDGVVFEKLPLLCDMYNLEVEDWSAMENEYNNHFCIGFDGSGFPVCVNNSGEVCIVLMDYTLAGDFQWTFVNSSLEKMAMCFIEYSRFLDVVLKETKAASAYEADIPLQIFENFKNKLLQIEPELFSNGSLWEYELEEFESRVN